MDKESYKQQTIAQIKELTQDIERIAIAKVDSALASGAVPSYFIAQDSYLLAKAILDSISRDRRFMSKKQEIQEDYHNIHLCI